ncbi:oxysterol-binding protein [Grosmannia clavigera kw1407]|uniref:Oxysterol-binding protein n=1 Tax=Grosmannia clavigera (strain kw1407 / UAMH 11150) TaxID=655863 RepID=F0XCM1_GROCL|nr:oxysterol-binding protein [Grosmannia clavigera kw1407]EFX03679.1 oxysterol-binding protein [Grosmannia clavigera kw1407]
MGMITGMYWVQIWTAVAVVLQETAVAEGPQSCSHEANRVSLATAPPICAASEPAALIPALQQTCSRDHESIGVPGYRPAEAHGLWEVRPSPGKGRGMFAVVDIVRGTRLLEEQPLFVVSPPPLVPGVGFSLSSMQPVVEEAFAGLSTAQQVEFRSLHEVQLAGEESEGRRSEDEEGNKRSEEEKETHGRRLMRILRSNGYNTQDGRVAIYPKAALVNHDCRPNVFNTDVAGRRVIMATRDIAVGEELLTTYVPLLADTTTRQRRLIQYGFHCSCVACLAGERDGAGDGTDDGHRIYMGAVLDDLEAAVREEAAAADDERKKQTQKQKQKKQKRVQQLARNAAELAAYVETQGFADYYVRTSRLAVEFSFRADDGMAARHWAQRHLEHHRLIDETMQATHDAHALLGFVEQAVQGQQIPLDHHGRSLQRDRTASLLLAPSSVVEVGHCWGQRPAVFAAPALESSAERRCLLVLRMMLIALRSQVYVGGSTKTSIRKPLNAFLGELFLAEWTNERSSSSSSTPSSFTTRLVAEQVSHHPPITAMHLADETHGVRADGYARVEMTFAGSVQVRQVGHALVHIDRYDEDYLLPLPDVRVRGFLSGRLYPEIIGTYHIVASSGYTVELVFSGQGLAWGGTRNAFTARVMGREVGEEPEDGKNGKSGKEKKPKHAKHAKNTKNTNTARETLYIVEGVWSQGWTTTDARTGQVLERYEVDAVENAPVAIQLSPPEAQDPWESRRAWAPVIDGIVRGDLSHVVAEKSRIEQAQRCMRAHEAKNGTIWKPLLFRSSSSSHDDAEAPCPKATAARDTFHRLAAGLDLQLHDEQTMGVWRVDETKIQNLQRPFRGELTPLG